MSKKKEKDKKGASISKGQIKVRVYMRFGAEIRQKRAEYIATEKRDNYNNLVAINDEYDHNEDTDFSMEEVYAAMNITLGIAGLSIQESIKKIDAKVVVYEKRVKALEKHPELNKFANIWDEKRKLRELKIYKNYIESRSENGAYFKIEDGIRVYEYESIGGFLIPIWHGADNLCDYPDFTNKKKITMQETANIHSYFESKGSKKLMVNALVVVLVITVVLFGINVYAGFKLLDKHQELDDRAVQGAEFCSNQYARTYAIFNEVMENTFIKQYLEEQEEEKEDGGINSKITELLPNK